MSKVLFLVVCFLLVCATSLWSQDKIYYKENKTDAWKVTAITEESIRGNDPANPQIGLSAPSSKVLFVFNTLGNFLVIPKLFEKETSADLIKNFNRKVDNKFGKFDKIITLSNNVIVCTFGKEAGKKIEYTAAEKPGQISKSDVAVIIFKDGTHKMLASPEKVFRVLNEVQDLYTSLAISEDKDMEKDQGLKDKLLSEKNPSKPDSIAARQNPVSPPTATAKPAAQPSGTDHSKTPLTSAAGEKKLDSATLIKLQDKAIQNIKLLESYIIIISDKNSDPDMVSNAIDQAVALFVSEEARVEVSSARTGAIQPYRIKLYLNRLSALNYEKVNIEWYNVQYTSQLRKGPDGNYYGVIEFEQKFSAKTGDNHIYQDITRKTVEIILKTYKRNVGGESTLEWDVFLGNIGITETKPA